MKFIKYFDHLTDHKQNYEIGDYVIVTSDDMYLTNEIVLIENKDGDSFLCQSIYDQHSYYEIDITQIIRKAEQFEIDIIQYNL